VKLTKVEGGDTEMRKLISAVSVGAALLLSISPVMAAKPDGKGFDEFGYNNSARNFVGTCVSWHQGKFASTVAAAEAYCGVYSYDKLNMKWNAEWDRGNAENWANGPYDAWENNLWNGAAPGGSGEVWHYKIKWVGDYVADPTVLPEGSYGIWDQFAVLMDQGSADGLHTWLAKATPNGYGVSH
jgi:hypothetical protein